MEACCKVCSVGPGWGLSPLAQRRSPELVLSGLGLQFPGGRLAEIWGLPLHPQGSPAPDPGAAPFLRAPGEPVHTSESESGDLALPAPGRLVAVCRPG